MKHMTLSTIILNNHPKDVLDDILWEDNITKLIVEGMRENSVRLQGELESYTISTSCQQSLHIVLHNLNSLIESYVGVDHQPIFFTT